MKRVHRDKEGDGSLVRNQKRIAAVVPRINRLSTAYQPLINRLSTGYRVHPSVYIEFPLFVLSRSRSRQSSSMPRWPHRMAVF